MPKYLHDFPGFGPLIDWYQQLKSKGRLDQFVSEAESQVVEWKHSKRAWFPEIPFAEKLYGRKWMKETSNTFAHGLDDRGKLVFLKWHTIVAYSHQPKLIQRLAVLRSTGTSELQAASHVTLNDDGQPLHVANIMDYRSSLNKFEYDDGRLVRLISTAFEHPNIDRTKSTELPLREIVESTGDFCYNSDGQVESGPEAYWSF